MSKGSEWLRGLLQSNGVPVDESQCALLDRYCSLLLEWNKKINLISRRSKNAVWEEQILHSISFLSRLRIAKSASVIDIGTGGGLPGIPLKILMPGLSMTLVDSIGKKVDAVKSIVKELGIPRTEVIRSRAEDLNRGSGNKRFYDYVVCRGVGQLTDICKYGFPLLDTIASSGTTPQGQQIVKTPDKVFIPPGAILALKGGDLQEEQKHATKKKGITITVIEISLRTSEVLANNEKKVAIMRPQKSHG